MQRWTRALGAALVLVGISAGSAFAWPDRLDGRPEQFEVGGDSAYYIWTDGDNDFHLATTGPGPRRNFVAVIHTDGEITDVDQVGSRATTASSCATAAGSWWSTSRRSGTPTPSSGSPRRQLTCASTCGSTATRSGR